MSEFNTRREFLQRGMTLLGAGLTAPYFLSRTALAMQGLSSTQLGQDRILVVLQMAGGNDGLNTVVPYRQDAYYRSRPQLAIESEKLLKLNDELGLHPSATGLKKLYDEGTLAIALGVGYPNPNRSHFSSTDIWASADPKQRTHSGWLGRYLDQTGKAGKRPDPELGIATTTETPLALQGDQFCPICFDSPEELTWKTATSNRNASDALERLHHASAKAGEGAKPMGALDFVRRASLDARVSAEQIRKAAGAGAGEGKFRKPGAFLGRGKSSLDQQLKMVVQMITAGLPTKIYYVSLGGFDTHSQQIGRHQNLMKELGDSLASFLQQVREKQLQDRVLLMSFSEFGRRVSENASGGTDHGTAAPLFILGERVKAGVQGNYPDLGQLDKNGDLQFTTDFRSIYAGVLRDWLGTNPSSILGGQFSALSLLKRS